MKCFFRIICCITMFVSCTTTKKETTLTKDYSTIRSFEVTHAVLSTGKLIRVDSFSSKYIPARPVDVWLPSNYSKNKKKYWVRIQGQALHNKNGEIIKFFAIEEDITLEKEFNQQLIESENRLTSLIENLQSGILLEDENRKIQIVNKKFCTMFGIQVEPELMKGVDCAFAAEESKHFFKNPDYRGRS